MSLSGVISRGGVWTSISYSVVHIVDCILTCSSSELSCKSCTLSTILDLSSSVSLVVEVGLVCAKSVSSSHVVLFQKSTYALVVFLTSLNSNFFSGSNVSDNYNTPYLCNRRSCCRASAEVKIRIP